MSKAYKSASGALVGVWSTPVQLNGADGANGTNGTNGAAGADGDDGDSIYVEYSVDGATSWHSTFTAGDTYMRQKVGAGGTWSSAMRIIGEKGDKGDKGDPGDPGAASTFTLTLNQSGAPFNTCTGGGTYPAGTLVAIHADSDVSGRLFDYWSAAWPDSDLVQTASANDTFVLMSKDITLTANYS